jgi:hypothetical protein
MENTCACRRHPAHHRKRRAHRISTQSENHEPRDRRKQDMVEEREKAKLGEMVAQPCARLTANARARRRGIGRPQRKRTAFRSGCRTTSAGRENSRTSSKSAKRRSFEILCRIPARVSWRTRVNTDAAQQTKPDEGREGGARARFSRLQLRADLVPQTEQVVIGIRRRQRASSTRPCRSGRPGTSVSSNDGSCGADEREKLYPAALRAALTQLRPRRWERPCRSQHLPPATRVNHPLLLLVNPDLGLTMQADRETRREK